MKRCAMVNSSAEAPTIILAPDSFKGTLSSAEVSAGIKEVLDELMPHANIARIIMADGGEGTLSALASSMPLTIQSNIVMDPLGHPHTAKWGFMPERKIAVVEMAEASGLTLVNPSQKDPLQATSYGTGELIRAALDEGATTVLIGIGGSATNDGGMGVLSALGMRFLDSCGCELPPCGASLAHVSSIDYSELDARIKQTSFRVMCDVDNPLVGPRGATAVFGPQKGVTDSNFEILEQGMTSYAALLEKIFGEDVASMPGAGAAGGLGCALHTFLGAELVSGASCILDLANFDELLRESSFCITGEGHLDAQTAGGKAVAVVAERCAKSQVPCFVIAGGSDATPEDLRTMGLAALETCDGGGRGHDEALLYPRQTLLEAARRLIIRLLNGEFDVPLSV